MSKQWWAKKVWQIRDNKELEALFDIGDTLRFEPNPTAGKPSFFRIRFNNKNPEKAKLWRNRYVYPVGVKPPSTSLKHCWDDGKKPGSQAKGVKSDFDREAKHLRKIADDPETARLEGHIKYKSYWVIIRIFCFSKAQSDGKDWFAIDSNYTDVSIRQDGTGHGDPH